MSPTVDATSGSQRSEATTPRWAIERTGQMCHRRIHSDDQVKLAQQMGCIGKVRKCDYSIHESPGDDAKEQLLSISPKLEAV